MTHTLHRLGDRRSLSEDYVVLAMSAKGCSQEGAAPRLKRFLEMALPFHPVNYGDMKTGNCFSTPRKEILDQIQDVSIVHAVFTEEEVLVLFLKALKDADLGISVVVSGLMDRTAECARKAGLRRHTGEVSLGIWGHTDLLPGRQALEVTTMCGHGMLAARQVERLARRIRRGKITAKDAAEWLAGTCACGIFNPVRAARLLEAMAANAEDNPGLHLES